MTFAQSVARMTSGDSIARRHVNVSMRAHVMPPPVNVFVKMDTLEANVRRHVLQELMDAIVRAFATV